MSNKEELQEEIEAKKKEIAKKKAAKGGNDTLDPMIVDPAGVQQEKFSGTTSDAASRVEGATYEDVTADPDNAVDKATDAEGYDFPPGGDVDISTVAITLNEGEVIARPTVEDWVVLNGDDAAVPDALDGRRAVILTIDPDQEYYTPEEWATVQATVRTRDDYSATLTVPTTGVREIQRRGVNPNRT